MLKIKNFQIIDNNYKQYYKQKYRTFRKKLALHNINFGIYLSIFSIL